MTVDMCVNFKECIYIYIEILTQNFCSNIIIEYNIASSDLYNNDNLFIYVSDFI